MFLNVLRYQLGVEEIQVVMTHTAGRFVAADAITAITGRQPVRDWADLDAQGSAGHLALADWADMLVVLPATANLLSEVAHGAAGTPLTTLIIGDRCPVALCPAMNRTMWENPFVRRNVRLIRRFGITCLDNLGGVSVADASFDAGIAPDPVTIFRQIFALRKEA